MAGYYSPFLQHVLSCWNHRHEEHMLFITYEEMKSDLAGVVSRVASFLGKTLSPKQVESPLCIHPKSGCPGVRTPQIILIFCKVIV